MTYKAIDAGLRGIIEATELAPSTQAVSYDDAPANKFNKTYILKPDSGEMGDNSETLCDRFYDNEIWSLQIAYSRSTHSDVINLGEINKKREELIRELDDPANWRDIARMIKYKSWDFIDTPNYYIVEIKIAVTDRITY